MGRGGPPEPEVVETPPTVDELVALSRAGRHAASDHLEIAALAGVPTIGCRRAGGGLAGSVVRLERRRGRAPRGRARARRRRLRRRAAPRSRRSRSTGACSSSAPGTTSTRTSTPTAGSISDLVVAVGCELAGALPATLRLRPLEPLEGRVAVFTAGATDVVAPRRRRRPRLGATSPTATRCGASSRVDADTYLVELKAAAIDVVAEHALARGIRVVLAANDVVGDGLDEALLALAAATGAPHDAARATASRCRSASRAACRTRRA